MENESKREMPPKKDEWFLVDEKIFPLQSSQGAISRQKILYDLLLVEQIILKKHDR